MPQSSNVSKKKSKPTPSESAMQLLEKNRAKNRALRKLLKLINSEEINDNKVTEPKPDDKHRSTNRYPFIT